MKPSSYLISGEKRFVYLNRGPSEGPQPGERKPAEQTTKHGIDTSKAERLVEGAQTKLEKAEKASDMRGKYQAAFRNFEIAISVLGGQIEDIWDTQGKIDINLAVDAIHDLFQKAGLGKEAPAQERIRLAIQGTGSRSAFRQLITDYTTFVKNKLSEKQQREEVLTGRFKAIYETAEGLLRAALRANSEKNDEKMQARLRDLTELARKNWGFSDNEINTVLLSLRNSVEDQAVAFAKIALQKDTPLGGLDIAETDQAEKLYFASR